MEYYAFTEQEMEVVPWLAQMLDGSEFQILHQVVNEFGTPNITVSGLIRIELHVANVAEMGAVLHWPNEHIHPEKMLVKDRDGQLLALLRELAARPGLNPAQEAQQIFDRALNWLVFGWNVLGRGERARALELLRWLQAALLRLARLAHGQTAHWLNPYRMAEQELSPAVMQRYAALTGGLDQLERCYRAAWAWLEELAHTLGLYLAPDFRRELTVTLAE
ncbi:hypothetical protein D3875_17420 [Deinococcus cavernae]|uniref:Lincosamide nucleotidyltransferase-like C-terminal domain-containing protein n=1 Tax=Deinococcus cavernae TaxID=2320857 RepID=A0A418VAA9_9DEIO|nr:hypothetical protein [Deinococcus cavernae]RJF73058.1 hypothetical protein D3875_17420 [Deinococcus cavernae]